MKIAFVISASLATLAVCATPVFASGYGPAPFYRPDVASYRPHWRHARQTQSDNAPGNDDKATTPVGQPKADPAPSAPTGSVN